jgi:hypothetical protein
VNTVTRILFRTLAALFLLGLCSALAAGQQQQGWGGQLPPAREQQPPPQQQSSASTDRTDADENFELNIAERRITERDFAASTSVEAGEESARGLRLRVGVEVGASEIDVLLRNVRGRVRFRATLERVLERLTARRPQEREP